MLHDESFGIVPLAKREGGWSVFLIQHTRGGYWGFPKGHAEPGESPREAAERELKEETGLEVVSYLQEGPLEERYSFMKERRRVQKKVSYFIAEVRGEVRLQVEEIANGAWVPLAEALSQITHVEGRDILGQVQKIVT